MAKSDAKGYGLGRRKTSVARVRLVSDKETQLVNGKPIEEYFETVGARKYALRPLESTSQADEFGLEIKVEGGGKRSQAGAISLGIARALVDTDEGFRKQLKDEGLLTRDARVKERKKPGLKRARRAPQFSKR